MKQLVPCPQFCERDGYECPYAALITDEEGLESNTYCQKFNKQITFSTLEELGAALEEAPYEWD